MALINYYIKNQIKTNPYLVSAIFKDDLCVNAIFGLSEVRQIILDEFNGTIFAVDILNHEGLSTKVINNIVNNPVLLDKYLFEKPELLVKLVNAMLANTHVLDLVIDGMLANKNIVHLLISRLRAAYSEEFTGVSVIRVDTEDNDSFFRVTFPIGTNVDHIHTGADCVVKFTDEHGGKHEFSGSVIAKRETGLGTSVDVNTTIQLAIEDIVNPTFVLKLSI